MIKAWPTLRTDDPRSHSTMWPHKFGGVDPEATDPRPTTAPVASPQPTTVPSTPPIPLTGWRLALIWATVIAGCVAVWALIVWAAWSLL